MKNTELSSFELSMLASASLNRSLDLEEEGDEQEQPEQQEQKPEHLPRCYNIDELIQELQKIKAAYGSGLQVAYGDRDGVDTEDGVFAKVATVNAYGSRYNYLVFDRSDDYF